MATVADHLESVRVAIQAIKDRRAEGQDESHDLVLQVLHGLYEVCEHNILREEDGWRE